MATKWFPSTSLLQLFQAIADAGATVIVSGGKIGDMALHYINKYNMMAVRIVSKWDIRRLAKAKIISIFKRSLWEYLSVWSQWMLAY